MDELIYIHNFTYIVDLSEKGNKCFNVSKETKGKTSQEIAAMFGAPVAKRQESVAYAQTVDISDEQADEHVDEQAAEAEKSAGISDEQAIEMEKTIGTSD